MYNNSYFLPGSHEFTIVSVRGDWWNTHPLRIRENCLLYYLIWESFHWTPTIWKEDWAFKSFRDSPPEGESVLPKLSNVLSYSLNYRRIYNSFKIETWVVKSPIDGRHKNDLSFQNFNTLSMLDSSWTFSPFNSLLLNSEYIRGVKRSNG